MPVPKDYREVDTDNIQGSIWPRLPKFYETYLFFKITNKERFRQDLRGILDRGLITTGTECEEHLTSVGEFKEACAYSRREMPENQREPFTAINVAFTHVGLLKVEHPDVEANFAMALKDDPDEYCRDRINEGLFEKGMFDDLVYEGADNPPALDPDFRAPPDNETKTGSERWKWRVDGVFIVAAHNARALRRKIAILEDAFNVGDVKGSMRIAFRRDGRVRPGADRGKEHFGYEDHISQPRIDGLDDPPEKGEPQACLPGYIFCGLNGDPNRRRGPKWAKEGSFLVFRQLDQKVPEFETFLEKKAWDPVEGIPGTNYKGPHGPAKLGAHLMGRWKSGTPVARAIDHDDPALAFDNKFDFRPKKSITRCPFAAHVRKMRPRADKKHDIGGEDDDSLEPLPEPGNDEAIDEGQREDASVILRRGITFGPELTDEEKSLKKTIEHRGMYFTCYQSGIRDGFNFLMTRWASNSSFPEYKTKTFPDGPGMDPFVNQRLRHDHPEGHISLYDGANKERTVKVDLGISPWVDQKGGEYFFTPSLRALREQFSTESLEEQSQSQSPTEDLPPAQLLDKIKQLEQEKQALEKAVGYAGLIRLDFLTRLNDADLRKLKHQVRDALERLASDVNWEHWREIIEEFNGKYGFDLLYDSTGLFEGISWSDWKYIHSSTQYSGYHRTVAYRNRLGQWCNNSKQGGTGEDGSGNGLLWLTFIVQLHDVLQAYKPEIH
ncbi:hypothetical protein BDV25DRAFT_135033 [Aspergillus avenaceus]|uniref:DyP dimeric alpha+beta barrel domain-containing protein n=1 Tax=Aspergillus avenaceus TaxID=36643 RepID=A0A5N6U9L1_ASPAV|nr:hypothetical protein BDV25DRAFT_135033 [Aspergillus avenaceus]